MNVDTQAQPDGKGQAAPTSGAVATGTGQEQLQLQLQTPAEQPAAFCSASPVPLVARSYRDMAAVLWGPVASGVQTRELCLPAARPVRNALAAGALAWRPVPERCAADQAALRSDRPCLDPDLVPKLQPTSNCAIDVLVYVVRRGSAKEGAQLCAVAGVDAASVSVPLPIAGAPRRRAAPAASDGSDAESLASEDSGVAGPSVDAGQLSCFGHVCSEAPRGAPKSGACSS